QHAEQRRLARAVGADHTDDAAGRQPETEILDQQMVAEALADALRLDDEIAETRAGRQHDLRRLGRLLAALRDQRIIGRDPRLALGLAGARALPHPFQFALQGAAARLLLPALGLEPRLLLFEPARVIALERDAAAAVELEDPARHLVEEIAVV